MQKKVEYFKDQIKIGEKMSDCNNISLPAGSEYFEKYWLECLREIHNYEKRPILFSQHLLITDDRLKKGFDIYKNKGIKELVKTDVDIRAIVESKTEKGKSYDVVIKCWKPDKLLRYRYDIIAYLENLMTSCTCKDFIINGKYRNNCSLQCPHISAVLWWMMDNSSIPKFLIKPEEKENGYQKSNNIDLVKELKCLPMKKFTPFLNIVALREFRDIPTNLALSIHRIPNSGYEKDYPNGIPNVWCTIDEPNQIERMIRGLIQGLCETLASRKNSEEQITKAVRELLPEGIINRGLNEEKDQKIKELEEKNKLLIVENIKLNEKVLLLENQLKQKKSLWEKIKGFFKKK